MGWMQSGYVYATAVTPDYTDASIPYAEPARPMRSFSELAAIDYAKEVFFDENGLPNANFWRFENDVSIFTFSQPNINSANGDVLAAAGQYTDAQRQHVADYMAGPGQYAQQGMQWFTSTSTLASVAGLGGNAAPFGTTITALRILVTVHEGSSQFRLAATVSPQGGATLNLTAATNATSAATNASATTATSVTNAAQPSTTATSAATAAAASQSINYPFTLLEMLEDDEIPQPPPEVPQS
jgi:general secretion pathway protein K